MDRRQFGSTVGISALASTLGIPNLRGEAAAAPEPLPAGISADKIGRPVRVVSIAFTDGHPLEQIAALVDQEAARGTDLIALARNLPRPESQE